MQFFGKDVSFELFSLEEYKFVCWFFAEVVLPYFFPLDERNCFQAEEIKTQLFSIKASARVPLTSTKGGKKKGPEQYPALMARSVDAKVKKERSWLQ